MALKTQHMTDKIDKEVKVELFRYGNVLFGRVVSMPEFLRIDNVIISKGKYQIKSSCIPDITDFFLYLNGSDKGSDGKVMTVCFDSEEEAAEAAEAYKELLEFLNAEIAKAEASGNGANKIKFPIKVDSPKGKTYMKSGIHQII